MARHLPSLLWIGTILMALLLSISHVSGQTFTSVQSGSWNAAATWGNTGNNYPGNNDNVIIASGHTITQDLNRTINNLVINSSATLTTNATLRVNGSYQNNGTHNGSNQVRLQGTGTNMSGTGTISTSSAFRVDNKRTIPAGSSFTITSGGLRCPNNDTLFNYGTVTLQAVGLSAAASGSFYNGSSGILYANRAVLSTGSLIASEAGNSVYYNRTGAGAQTITKPVDGYYNLYITGNNVNSIKSLEAATTVINDLTISSSTFSVVDTFSLFIGGDLTLSSGSFNTANGTVILNGSSTQSVSGNISFINLVVNHAGSGVTLSSGTMTLSGSLLVSNGTLNTQGRLTLLSSASGDASIGPVGGVISGDVTMQRYIGQGATNWRFMGSPVEDATLLDWEDDFIMSGFPGCAFPSFPFTSIYGYDEPTAGHQDSGFVIPTGINDAISPGTGFWVFCGDSLEGTDAFTIDVTGPVAQGSFDFSITYTSTTGGTANDGWNLVANPYPSAIDWDSPDWVKSNVDNAIYMWNTNMDQYSSYVGGVGTNGGANVIPIGHGFYVKANAGSPALQVQETAKLDTTVAFLRQNRPDHMLARLAILQEGRVNETVVRIVPGSVEDFDSQYDAIYFPSFSGNNVALFSRHGEVNYSINSLSIQQSDTVNLHSACLPGSAEIRYDLEKIEGDFCVVLFDKLTGNKHLLDQQGTVSFENEAEGTQQRFSLVITRNNSGESAACDSPAGFAGPALGNASPANVYCVNRQVIFGESAAAFQGSAYKIVAMDGRLVQSGKINADSIDLKPSMVGGIYMITVEHPGFGTVKIAVEG